MIVDVSPAAEAAGALAAAVEILSPVAGVAAEAAAGMPGNCSAPKLLLAGGADGAVPAAVLAALPNPKPGGHAGQTSGVTHCCACQCETEVEYS